MLLSADAFVFEFELSKEIIFVYRAFIKMVSKMYMKGLKNY